MSNSDIPQTDRGSFACPICGHEKKHYHSLKEKCDWLKAQGERFGIRAVALEHEKLPESFNEVKEAEAWLQHVHTEREHDECEDSICLGKWLLRAFTAGAVSAKVPPPVAPPPQTSQEYPGQKYFHDHNANIKRAELNAAPPVAPGEPAKKCVYCGELQPEKLSAAGIIEAIEGKVEQRELNELIASVAPVAPGEQPPAITCKNCGKAIQRCFEGKSCGFNGWNHAGLSHYCTKDMDGNFAEPSALAAQELASDELGSSGVAASKADAKDGTDIGSCRQQSVDDPVSFLIRTIAHYRKHYGEPWAGDIKILESLNELWNDGFETAHSLRKCGHSMGDFRDSGYILGQPNTYTGSESCIGCETVATAAKQAREERDNYWAGERTRGFNAGRREGYALALEEAAKHEPQMYMKDGPITGVNGAYTIAFSGCSCGWNSDGEASKKEKWGEHIRALAAQPSPQTKEEGK